MSLFHANPRSSAHPGSEFPVAPPHIPARPYHRGQQRRLSVPLAMFAHMLF